MTIVPKNHGIFNTTDSASTTSTITTTEPTTSFSFSLTG